MDPGKFEALRVGDPVLISNGPDEAPTRGTIADKVSEHPFVYTLLVKVGQKAGKPLFRWADIRNVRKGWK